MRFRRLLLPFLLLAAGQASAAPLAMHDGESLDYRVAWGIFLHAGEIAIKAHAETNDGRPCTVVESTTSTRGFLRGLFRFEARATAVFENDPGRMLVLTESSAGGRKKTSTSLELNYTANTAKFTDFVDASHNETIQLPEGGPPLDLIMSLIQTREWDLKPGDARDLNVVFEKDIYQLTVHALRYEDITTPMGKYHTLVYEPRMEKTPPMGMFKRGSQVHVWIAQNDLRKLPVKFEVEFSFGTGVATLVDYQPPGTRPVPAK